MTLSHAAIKRITIASIAMLIGMFVLWWSIWTIAAAQFRDFIDGWIEAHSKLGYQVTYSDRDTEGFPRDISLHFSNFVLQSSDGIKIHANDVSLSAFPWQWHDFDAKLKHGFDLTIPFTGEKTLYINTYETARNHTELEENGDWKFIDLHLMNAKALWGTEPFFSANDFAIAFKRPDVAPKDHTEAGLTFNGTASGVTMPPGMDSPFGAKVSDIDIAMRIMGPVPDPRKKESVAAWNTEGGLIEFEKFVLNWGPLVMSARGTLALDDDLQPEGAFSSQIGNHEEVLKTLMAQNQIPQRDSKLLNSALNLFAKHSTLSGKPSIEVPITVQLGGLFLGPVHVFAFDEIKWDGEETQPPAVLPTPAPTSLPAQDLPAH